LKDLTMTPERTATLQEVMHGCLAHAALFRRWLSDGDNTARVREEYDGLIAMFEEVFHEVLTGVRDAADAEEADEAYAALCRRIDPRLPWG
jgi:hypothetical protein